MLQKLRIISVKGTLAVETGGKHFEKLSITNSVFRDIRLVLCSDSPSPQPFTAGVLYPRNADPDGAARSRCAESTSLHTHAHQVRDRQNPLKPRSLTMSNLPRTPRWRRLRLPKSTAANRPPRPPFDTSQHVWIHTPLLYVLAEVLPLPQSLPRY